MPYVNCLNALVAENDRRNERDYIRHDEMIRIVERDCAGQRKIARDVLASSVARRILAADGRRMPADEAWKDEVIGEATGKWMGRGFGSGQAQ
jgi:hypothetical protein